MEHETQRNDRLHKLIFIHGKGGVGKTTIAHSLAEALKMHHKILWAVIEDTVLPPHQIIQLDHNLWRLNCSFKEAFEEYLILKIKNNILGKLISQSKLIQHLSAVAPGLHDLVVMGKLWYEIRNYDAIIIDMPSSGYSYSMLQSVKNFSDIFQAGPLFKDTKSMQETLADPQKTLHIIISLAEFLPISEALELRTFIVENYKQQNPFIIVNRILSDLQNSPKETTVQDVISTDPELYLAVKNYNEYQNIERLKKITDFFTTLPYIHQEDDVTSNHMTQACGNILKNLYKMEPT